MWRGAGQTVPSSYKSLLYLCYFRGAKTELATHEPKSNYKCKRFEQHHCSPRRQQGALLLPGVIVFLHLVFKHTRQNVNMFCQQGWKAALIEPSFASKDLLIAPSQLFRSQIINEKIPFFQSQAHFLPADKLLPFKWVLCKTIAVFLIHLKAPCWPQAASSALHRLLFSSQAEAGFAEPSG